MANDAVTHEQLRAGQMAMLDRFDTHEKRFHEVTVRLFDKIEEGAAMGHSNQLALGKIDEKLAGMSDKAVTVGNRLDKIEATVTTLVADGNRREGERGVIAALLRSPFIAWLAALGAVIWAAIKNTAPHLPCIAFAVTIAVMAASSAIAAQT